MRYVTGLAAAIALAVVGPVTSAAPSTIRHMTFNPAAALDTSQVQDWREDKCTRILETYWEAKYCHLPRLP
jgi:hypothetical protein